MTPIRWTLAGIGAAVLLLIVGTAVWNYRGRELADARRETEAAQLTLKGLTVAKQESDTKVAATLAELLATKEDLRAAVDAARAASPGARPLRVATLETESGPVENAPRAPPSASISEGGGPEPRAAPEGGGQSSGPPAPVCDLAVGDRGSIKVYEVTLGTELGNHIVTGTAEFWRDVPGPRAKLYGGPFKASLSDVHEVAPPAPPGWGAGLLGVCGAPGCSAGAAVLFPPATLLGLRLEALAGATAGTTTQVLGMLGGRF